MTCGLLNSPILGTSIGTYQPETTSWIIRTEAAGGTLSTGTKNAVDAFVVSCKAAAIFTKFKRLNLFCGSNFTACLSPLVNTAGTAMDTNVSMPSANYSESTGLLGNGTSYLDTGLVPNTTVPYNNWHMANYVLAAPATSTLEMGSMGHPNGNIQFRCGWNYGAGPSGQTVGLVVISGDYNIGLNPNFQTLGTAGATITNGLALASRTSASSLWIRNTSGTVNQESTLGYSGQQVLPVNTFQVFTATLSGQISRFRLGSYSVGLGLTYSEMTSYLSIMQSFQAALGRAT